MTAPLPPTTPPPVRAESALRHLAAGVPTARREESVAAVVARLAAARPDCADVVCVTGDKGRFLGAVRLVDLLRADRDAEVGALAGLHTVAADPDDDQERVAGLAVRHGLEAVPVVDRSGRLLGAVPSVALLAILRREHVEDLHRIAGITRETDRARMAIEDPPVRRARHRLPWLLVGLAGSVVATLVVSAFEEVLERRLAVAFFVPGIVYLADAIGTQTEAVAVRGISLSRLPLRELLWGEMRTGALIGLTLAALAFAGTAAAFGDVRLAAAVAAAILAAGTTATFVGLLLPWGLSAAGQDPAFGSGPVATVIQDVLSLLVYFAAASLFL